MKKLSAIVISALFAVSLLSACSGALDFSAPKDGLTSRSSAIMRQADHSANNDGNYYGGYSSSSETPWWYSQQAASTVTGDTAYYPSASADVGYSVYYPPVSGDTSAIDPWQPGQSSDDFWGDDPFAPESYQVFSGSDSHGNSEPDDYYLFDVDYSKTDGENYASFVSIDVSVEYDYSEKFVKDGWLYDGYFYGAYLRLPRAYNYSYFSYGGDFYNMCIRFYAPYAGKALVYATCDPNMAASADLKLIDENSNTIDVAEATGTVHCLALDIPRGGYYALIAGDTSDINVFAIRVTNDPSAFGVERLSLEDISVDFTETDIDRAEYFDAPYEYSTVYKAFTATDGWLNGQTLKYAVSIDYSYSEESALMRSIGFYAEDACKIYVYAAANDDFGEIVVCDEAFLNLYGFADLYDSERLACYTFELPSSGYYRLFSLSGVVNVYAIRIEY